jgi:hypothetical protein
MTVPDRGQTVLWSCQGLRLKTVGRAFYEHRGEIDESRGPLELTFEDGRVIHLTTASNGESVAVREGPWYNPVVDPDAPPDEDWAREHGRWIRVDVSTRPEYAEGIGAPLLVRDWVVNQNGSIAGVELSLGLVALTFASWGDDEYVVFGRAGALPREWGMQRYPTMVMEA